MVTSDVVYLVDKMPAKNQKMMADELFIGAGGPACNASVTFASFGNRSCLVGAAGSHSICEPMKADLKNNNIDFLDLSPNRTEPPVVSSIISTKSSGDRAVVSMNAPKIETTSDQTDSLLKQTDIVLADGHQMTFSIDIAKAKGPIPMVADAGSWKPGFELLLPMCDYVICSADFKPPKEDVFEYLQNIGVKKAAITHGPKPIVFFDHGKRETIEIDQLNKEDVVDTMGAGDILHGAFCHYILNNNFRDALVLASKTATKSCRYFGTRKWIASINN